MIDHLIEIVFQNVPSEKIGSLIKNLTSNGQRIINYNLTCANIYINWETEESIKKIFNKNKNFGLFVN